MSKNDRQEAVKRKKMEGRLDRRGKGRNGVKGQIISVTETSDF